MGIVDPQEVSIRGPFVGLNTLKHAALLDDREASDCANVMLDQDSIKNRYEMIVNSATVSPTTASDTFTRADNASLGASWTETETNGTYAIVSNRVKALGGAGAPHMTALHTTAIGTDQIVQADVYGDDSGSGNSLPAGLAVRATDASNFYGVLLTIDALGVITQIEIRKRVAGTNTTLVQKAVSIAQVSGKNTLKVIIIGRTILVYIDGTFYLGWKDSSLTTGNLCGLYCGSTSTLNGYITYFDTFSASRENSVRGVRTYFDTNGKLWNFCKIYQSIYYLNSTGVSATSLASGLVAGTIPAFCDFGGRLYFPDGSTTPQCTDGSALFSPRITAPSAPTCAANATAAMTGIYTYKYTYYSSTWGIESQASPESTSITLQNQSVDLTLSTSGDSRVDKMRVYRKKISAGESTWTFVAEFAQNTAYTDSIRDDNRKRTPACPISSTASLPAFKYCASFGQRMWWATDNRLYWSEIGRPGTVTDENENWIQIGDASYEDPITGLVGFMNHLVIFKRRSIWLISDPNPVTMVPRPITYGTGCVSNATIVTAENYVYFAGEYGIYRYDVGSLPENISEPVEPSYNARIKDADELMFAVHDVKNKCVIFSMFGQNETNNKTCYVFFYRHSRRVQKYAWTKWEITVPFTAGAYGYGIRRKENSIVWGSADGGLGQVDFANAGDATDAAVSEGFTARWVSPMMDGGKPHKMKQWTEMTAEVAAAVMAVNMKYLIDNETSPTTAGTIPSNDVFGREAVVRSSRYIRLRLDWQPNIQNVEVLGFGIGAELTGRGRT
jgi:hypothetical protein